MTTCNYTGQLSFNSSSKNNNKKKTSILTIFHPTLVHQLQGHMFLKEKVSSTEILIMMILYLIITCHYEQTLLQQHQHQEQKEGINNMYCLNLFTCNCQAIYLKNNRRQTLYPLMPTSLKDYDDTLRDETNYDSYLPISHQTLVYAIH